MYSNQNEQRDFMLFPESTMPQNYAASQMNLGISPEGYTYTQQPRYEQASYTDAAPQYMYNTRMSPGLYHDDGPSNLSTASVPSAPSSTLGSPNPNHGQMTFVPEHHVVNLTPGIVGHGHGEYFVTGTEYPYDNSGMEEYAMPQYEGKPDFVDPSMIHPEIRGPLGPQMHFDTAVVYHQAPPNMFPHSPALSGATSPAPIRAGSQSPYMQSFQQYSPFSAPPPQAGRRPSLCSYQSPDYMYSGDEAKDKQRCPHPDCGKIFKDLKAHMLTHQSERPEKCPITTCDYNIKGFARKYDKNRHTLTHYKGTMVCGFCPGSGSAAEKSFNRADVFKRHLTAVHGVEQTPPNSRKKSSSSVASSKNLAGYAPDATGKCSTCSATFSNAQDFYEHLDDCVLRIVQQEDPAEAINAKRLGEVEHDVDVVQTLQKNHLPLTTQTTSTCMDEDQELGFESDEDSKKFAATIRRTGPSGGVQKSRGMTHSRGGPPALQTKTKNRKNRRDYPSSWGFDKGQMTMKKRVMTAFDGPRRLAKDEMMLSNEHEVRIKLSDGVSYVTDLDINTLKRANGFHDATEEEKGHWISDDPTPEDKVRMLAMSGHH